MSDESELYKVQIEGAGLSFSRDIDAPTLGRVMHAMLGSSASTPTSVNGEDVFGEAPNPRTPPLSLREFLLNVGAKRYPDKIVAIGHYLEEYEGKAGFSRDDIKSRFRTAGEPPPGNFPRDFSVTLSHGWIAEDAGNPGQLYVTTSGRDALQQGFSNISRPARRRGTRRRRVTPLSYQSA